MKRPIHVVIETSHVKNTLALYTLQVAFACNFTCIRDLGIGGRIIFNKWDGAWSGLICSGKGHVAGFCHRRMNLWDP